MKTFESYVTSGILANNEFGIMKVADLETVKSMYFNREDYNIITEIINAGDIGKILDEQVQEEKSEEFLIIMKFMDQESRQYIVTIYDSIFLEQDPQVIDIFKDIISYCLCI